MDESLIQIVVLAFIAGFVLVRLYTTLGRRTGAERPEPRPAPVQGGPPPELAVAPARAPAGGGSASEALAAISRADPNFEADAFLTGARGAYELIVGAFAKGDTEALRPLLTPRVFASYDAAIKDRVEKGGQGPELVRLRTAEIADADLQGQVARVTVRFEAELAEGMHGMRDAREQWTFERDVRSSDPNWRLARVAAA